jgi:predicted SAM-dependent methyltransferase
MKEAKLHLGCGNKNFGQDWIHIDGGDFKHLHSRNICILPFKDKTVDLIYASHVLEYFDRDEVLEVLLEWKRVLKEGGILRLSVPNFDVLSRLYQSGTPIEQVTGPLYGRWNMRGQWVYHRTTYDHKSLKAVLESSGFKNIRLWDWRKTDHGVFDDYSQAYKPHMDKENGTLISLNIEAEK